MKILFPSCKTCFLKHLPWGGRAGGGAKTKANRHDPHSHLLSWLQQASLFQHLLHSVAMVRSILTQRQIFQGPSRLRHQYHTLESRISAQKPKGPTTTLSSQSNAAAFSINTEWKLHVTLFITLLVLFLCSKISCANSFYRPIITCYQLLLAKSVKANNGCIHLASLT